MPALRLYCRAGCRHFCRYARCRGFFRIQHGIPRRAHRNAFGSGQCVPFRDRDGRRFHSQPANHDQSCDLLRSDSLGHAAFQHLGVEVEFYRIFPIDSTNPPSNHVPTRTNSPADTEIASATRDSALASLSFTAAVLAPSFTAANSVVNGINASPNSFTAGEGPVTGDEVLIDVDFTTPILLAADHYFFRPEVDLGGANFLWLSAPKPIVAPGTPFTPDLQSWIRNGNISPDWLRIGTDITHQGPFNAAFSLSGETVPTPEPSSLLLLGTGLLGLIRTGLRNRRIA